MSRILALDIGDERIGLAVSDEGMLIAQPLAVIPRSAGSSSFMRIVQLIDYYNVTMLLVGWPLLPDGSAGKQLRSVEAYLRGLREYIHIPICTWDERFSTVEADNIIRSNTAGTSARKKRRDAVAAAVILQQYLDQSAERVQP